jgi:hypothetical protein
VPLRCARICGLLWLGGVGLSEMRSHLRVAGCGMAWSGAGTGRCGRISSALRRYVFVCGFLRLHLSGIPNLRAYLRVAVCGGLCRWYGSRRLDAYLAGAVEMRAYSRVAAVGRRRLAGDAFPSSGCRAWSGAGTGRCGRISSALRRYVFVCGFLSLRLSGIPDLRAYLRVAVRGGLCRCCGNRRLWVYFVGTVEMHAYLPVSAAVPVRLPGFTRLSPGSCVIGAVPSPGQTTPARAPSPASR